MAISEKLREARRRAGRMPHRRGGPHAAAAKPRAGKAAKAARFLTCPCCGRLGPSQRFGPAYEAVARVRTNAGYKVIRWTTEGLTAADKKLLREALVQAAYRLSGGR